MAHQFKFGGVEYPIPQVFTFKEARTVKRLTGMTLGEVDRQFATDGTDPDCIFAYFVVSVQRVRPDLSENEIEAVSMSDIELIIDGEKTADPPPEAGPSVGT